MDLSFEELLGCLGRLSGPFQELRGGVEKAIRLAEVAPDMALTAARKELDLLVQDVYLRRTGNPPATRTLEGLLEELVNAGHFPRILEARAAAVKKLGNQGAHSRQTFTPADVHRSLTQLLPILEWYVEGERAETFRPLGD